MSGKSWIDVGMEQIEGGVSQAKQKQQSTSGNIINAVVSQITGKSSDKGSNEAVQASAHAQQQAAQKANLDSAARQANEEMVKELYAPSEQHETSNKQQGSNGSEEQNESQKAASEFIQEKIEEGMTPEEAQKLYSLRRQLHSEYYQKLTNYGKQQPEERTADKVEKEKDQDDRMNLDEQKKKDAPIAVTMGANRAEQFPGASG